MRSATAETVFAAEGYSVKSAGTEETAAVPLSNDIILWADLIFVMEEKHKVIIKTYFSDAARNKNIIVLDIPDNYYYMEQELVDLLKERVAPHLNKIDLKIIN
jgi:protein-tyrosine phosphatase